MDGGEDLVRRFWMDRAQRPDFLWRDLVEANLRILSSLLSPSLRVLDLGAGDGRLTSRVAELVAHVKAVDYTPAILRLSRPNVATEVRDIRFYEDHERYDLVLLFGVMNFIEDAESLYRRCRGLVRPGGRLAIKHQCGRRATVRVSAAIDGVPYQSQYRFLGEEVALLLEAGFSGVESSLPYPPELNPWEDTVYACFVAVA